MRELMKSVDDIIQNDPLLSIIRESITENKIQFFSLLERSGGLGVPIFSEKAKNDFSNTAYIPAPLVTLIVMQEERLPNNESLSERIATIKQNNSNQLREKEYKESEKVNESVLLPDIKRAVLQTKEKNTSS